MEGEPERSSTAESVNGYNGTSSEKETLVSVPMPHLQRLIETNISLHESNQQVKEILIQVSSLLSDPSRLASYSTARSSTLSNPSAKIRPSLDSTKLEDNIDKGPIEETERHALDTESVRQVILQAPNHDEEEHLHPMPPEEIQKENELFQNIYKSRVLPNVSGPLPRAEDHLDWWAKVSKYLENLYELYRFGANVSATDTRLPGLDLAPENDDSRRYHCHDVVGCLYDTTRPNTVPGSRSSSSPEAANILSAHEFGQSLRLTSILRRLFDLLRDVRYLYSLHEIMGVLIYLGRTNQMTYEKVFWRTWWEDETGHPSPLLIAHNLEGIRKACYHRNIFRLYNRDPRALRERDLRLIWAAAQAMLFSRQEFPRISLQEKRILAPIGEVELFMHGDDIEVYHPLKSTPTWHEVMRGSKTFVTEHFSMKTLRELGSVDLRWTHDFNSHLKLEQVGETGQMILWIFWDLESVRRTRLHVKLCSYIPRKEYAELRMTYALLFQPSNTRSAARARRRIWPHSSTAWTYSSPFSPSTLPNEHIALARSVLDSYCSSVIPDLAKVIFPFQVETIDDALKLGPPFFHEMMLHMESALRLPLSDVDSFERYPIFQERLKVIKVLLDSRKPRGFRQLWSDKRDSLQWYTFWAVIIVGVLTVVLALAGLALGAAQTIAAFRQLDIDRSG